MIGPLTVEQLAVECAAAWRRVVDLCDAVPDGRMDNQAIAAETRARHVERYADRRRAERTAA